MDDEKALNIIIVNIIGVSWFKSFSENVKIDTPLCSIIQSNQFPLHSIDEASRDGS